MKEEHTLKLIILRFLNFNKKPLKFQLVMLDGYKRSLHYLKTKY